MSINPLSIINIPANSIFLNDPLNRGVGSTWTAWGNGPTVVAGGKIGLQVFPNGTANSYGGYITNSTYDLTSRFCWVYMQQPMTRQSGAVNTLQLQLNGSNYLEVGLIDDRLTARINVAGALTTLTSNAWPSVPGGTIWVSISEVGGQISFYYAATGAPFTQQWQFLAQVANPFAVTSMYVVLTAGSYAALSFSPGAASWNSMNAHILPSADDFTAQALGTGQGSTSGTFGVPVQIPLTGSITTQASYVIAPGQPTDRTPRMTGTTFTQASTTGQATVTGQVFAGATVTQASTTASLTLNLKATPFGSGTSTGLLVKGPSLTGVITTQASVSVTALLFGVVILQPSGTLLGLGTTFTQALILTRYPLSGVVIGQGSTTTTLGQSNAVIADIGIWPAGTYEVKTCCRTDVTGTPPVALTFAVQVGGSVAATTTIYAGGDASSTTYPTAYAQYDGRCTFSLLVPADIVFQWSNPGTYHNAGKHIWVKGAQLHRLS